MKMSETMCLPQQYVRAEVTEFMQMWGMNSRGLLLPGNGGSDLHVWHGKFIDDETVVMIADAETKIDLNTGLIYVGAVTKRDYDRALTKGKNPLEVYADSAFSPARGLHGAIGSLILMKGFPDGLTRNNFGLIERNV